jgi:hypothetical protein
MTDYEFGDVVLVAFPFTDMTTAKRRPAVVVNSVACLPAILTAVSENESPSTVTKSPALYHAARSVGAKGPGHTLES